ncbi:unnamed protein product [Caenorhabditis brenneri]
MKYTILILLLCLVATVAASSRNTESKKHCSDNSECSEYQACRNDLCITVQWPNKDCKTNQDCDALEYCNFLGQCATKDDEPKHCSDNSECSGAEECMGGRCSPIFFPSYPQQKTCKTAQDCNEGEVCGGNGRCNNASSINSPSGIIYGSPKHWVSFIRRCNATKDCNAREICAGGRCREDLSRRCFNNTDCTVGKFCVTGKCIILFTEKPRKCKTILDCYEGEVCSDHKLCDKASLTNSSSTGINVLPPRHCSQNTDCKRDMFCIQGLCSEIMTQKKKCKSTQDCNAGESCSPGGFCRVARSQQCSKSSQCIDDKICVAGSCINRKFTDQPKRCWSSQDCKKGEFCDSLRQCVDDQPQFEPTLCSDDSECNDGERGIKGDARNTETPSFFLSSSTAKKPMKTVLIFLFLVVGTFGYCHNDDDCPGNRQCFHGRCGYLNRFQAKPREFLPECIYDKDCPRKEQKCFANHCGFADDSKRRRLSMCNPDQNGDCTFGRKNFQAKPRGFLPECIYDTDCPRKEQKCFANHCGFADDSKRRLCNPDLNGDCTFGRKNFQATPRGFLPECIFDKDCPRKEQKCFANHCGFADDTKRRRSMCNMDQDGNCTCAQDSDCPAGGWCNDQGVCNGWEEFAAGGL